MEPAKASTVPTTRTPPGSDRKARAIVTEPSPVISVFPKGDCISTDMVSTTW